MARRRRKPGHVREAFPIMISSARGAASNRENIISDSRGRRTGRRDLGHFDGAASPYISCRCSNSLIRIGPLVAGVSRDRAGRFRGTRAVDACPQRRIFLPCWCFAAALGERPAIASDAGDGVAGAAQWLAVRGFRYDGQHRLGQQFRPRGLSHVPARTSVGVSGHALLAQAPHFRPFSS